MCRHDIWDSPVGWAMDADAAHPGRPGGPGGGVPPGAGGLLREGEVVCVFPEAGISAAYVVRALMPGAVALARETGAPLVPVERLGQPAALAAEAARWTRRSRGPT